MIKVTYFHRQTKRYAEAFTCDLVVFTASGIEFEGARRKYFIEYADISSIVEVEEW